MRQYNQIKRKHPDTILLFRLGDFFETFGDDAVTTARICGITLTKRNNGAAGDMPLAGFPHHQLDNYLPKLVRAGFRVAVCEQLEDPKLARGIVRRDVVEVVTPGIALYDKMLDARTNMFVCAVCVAQTKHGGIAGVAFADASTGEFSTCEIDEADIGALLETLSPAEIIIPKQLYETIKPLTAKLAVQPALTRREEWIFETDYGREQLLRHFKTDSLKGFGAEQMTAGVAAAGAVLHYISETQFGKVAHIRSLRNYNPTDFMMLDASTRRNLELTFSMNEKNDSSLVAVLDDTRTPMGGRQLKVWMMRPLKRRERITQRLDAVRALHGSDTIRTALREILGSIGDIERLISKVCTMRATTRDMIALKKSLAAIPLLKKTAHTIDDETLRRLTAALDDCAEVTASIEAALVDEPSIQFGAGTVFRAGYSAELDDIREAMYSGKNWVSGYQDTLREQTGIPSLKVGFNNVFGYYIEISNAHKSKAPESFTRKQTMTNAERFITPELKEIESKILNAEERITDVEQRLFNDLRTAVAEHAAAIQQNAHRIATLDCLQSFAEVARRNNYTEPTIADTTELRITNGRHPVVETLLPVGERYVPNSTTLAGNTDGGEQIHIITGPNMAGKSCYLRQVGLIVLLAHIGSFVPAESASIPLTDRIFTRVGAQDNISAGESTFLVEMQEAANILNNATNESIILLDEVGRGTATFDGISIAWAIAEHIHSHIGAKTLFATHYHELSDLAGLFPRIANYNVQVQEAGGAVMFTRKVVHGSTDHSFGIHVAQMAGLPPAVTERARAILATLEANNENLMAGGLENAPQPRGNRADTTMIPAATTPDTDGQLSMFELRDDALRTRLKAIDVNNLTPIQALQVLGELIREV
ncbi:MAG: DNA mismatch repair protein MutS [Candidatus Kapabacteria bacterium]|nr:DNA mismatch repair protein MutS [Candidatus Kapabacteria bacterium]